MGSIGFVDDEESRPCTSNSKKCKLPKKILGDWGAVNYISVPRKLRSAIKKRARESITPPLPNLWKNDHLSNGVAATLKKSAKKSKLNKKQKRLTKDEKEVAETLHALADMFTDASCNTNKLALDVETKSSTIIEDNGDKKISTEGSLEAICHSTNLVDSTELVQQPKLPFMKESEDQNNWGAFQSSSILPASGDSSSKTKLPPWLKNANSTSSQPNTVTVTADKNPRVHDVKSKNSWKRCSAHVYISRLIKVLQMTEKERKDDGRPSQSKSNGDAQLGPIVTNNQIKEERNNINIVPCTEIQDGLKQLFQDQQQQQQLVSKTSYGMGVPPAGGYYRHEAPRNYQAPSYLQSQISSTFSLPWNNFQGSTSNVAVAQQVPPYLNNISTMAQWGQQQQQQQQQQKRIMIPLLQYKYNNGGGATLAEWQHPNSLLNYTHPFPPHLGSKYYPQQQQQQLMTISSSRLDHQHRL